MLMNHPISQDRAHTYPHVSQPARAFAQFAHALDYNVVAIPPGLKRPLHRWAQWQDTRQTHRELLALAWRDPDHDRWCGWGDAERCALVNGIGGLRSIDIDAAPAIGDAPRIPVADAVIASLLAALGLPDDYPWVERSASGTGWHLWFRCDTPCLPTALATTRRSQSDKGASMYWGVSRDGAFDHLELR